MKYLKNAFDLYLNSSIHVSLAVVAFSMITMLENGLEIDLDLILFIFFASITGYNFVKYAGIAKLHHLSLAKNLRFIQLFSFICIGFLIYFTTKLSIEVVITTSIMGVFTLLYAIPLFGHEKNLRSLPRLKIFIIAVVWAGTTVIIPLINEERYLNIDLLIDFLQRLMLVIVLTLPFEIRDLDFDNARLGTIPQKLGVSKTKVFGTFLLLIIFFAEFIQKTFDSTELLALLIILVLTGMFLWKSDVRQGTYYSSFWVEALPLIYLGVYLLIKIFLLQTPS